MSCVSPSDVRSLFTPELPTSIATDSEIQAKIDFIETYAKYVYNGGDSLTCSKASDAIKILVSSKLIKNNKDAIKEYGELESIELGDLKMDFRDDSSIDQNISSWEERAEILLKAIGNDQWNVRLTND